MEVVEGDGSDIGSNGTGVILVFIGSACSLMEGLGETGKTGNGTGSMLFAVAPALLFADLGPGGAEGTSEGIADVDESDRAGFWGEFAVV